MLSFNAPFLNNGRKYEAVVKPQPRAGVPVAEYLALNWSHSTRAEWEERLSRGLLTVNDAVASAETRLFGGERLVYQRQGWLEPAIPQLSALPALLPRLYEDEDLLALHKPSGLPVMPGGMFEERSVLKILGEEGDPVQRLGRGTSGLLLLARNVNSARSLSAAFRDRALRKEYLALLQGTVPWQGKVIDVLEPIACARAERGALKGAQQAHWWVAASSVTPSLYDGKPKPSDSHYTVLGHGNFEGKSYSLCRVRIGTGRAHQIRIHSAFLGHPLLGDPLYIAGGGIIPTAAADEDEEGGGESSFSVVPSSCGYFLHSWRCEIPSSALPSGKNLTLSCPLPTAWAPYLQHLSWLVPDHSEVVLEKT